MDRNFNTSVKITYCLSVCSSKDVNMAFKRFQTAMHSGKIDNRHLFCFDELFLAFNSSRIGLIYTMYIFSDFVVFLGAFFFKFSSNHIV